MFLGIILVLFGIYWWRRKGGKELPKGPKGLPVLGNILQIITNPYLKFSEWAKQYGKMYTVSLAGQQALVVNDVKTMKEIFSTLASTGKFESECFEILNLGKHGVVNAEGEVWQEQHKFCLKALKQFGFGCGTQLGPVILNDCHDLCSWIDGQPQKSDGNRTVHLNKILLQVTSNSIWNMVTGEKLKSTESKMVYLIQQWIEALNTATKSGLVFISWLKYIAPEKSGYNRFFKVSTEIQNLVKGYFKQHEAARLQREPDSAPEDLIDAYIHQMENCSDENSSFYGETGFTQSFISVGSLLIAGSETTATSLNWLIFYMVAYPDVQSKVQDEINYVLGTKKEPDLIDRPDMPYLDAVILEVLRHTSFVPFGLIHKLLNSVSYEGYVLPKGLLLIANTYHANHDPKVWKDPESFRPERFLEGNQDQRQRLRESIASFQKGKRTCLGDQLAKDIMFLFTTKLLQKYSFKPDIGKIASEYLKPKMGYILLPPNLGVTIVPKI